MAINSSKFGNLRAAVVTAFAEAAPMVAALSALALALAFVFQRRSSISIAEVDELATIPTAGVLIYLGLISGYLPSPLYDRNERWPRWYAVLQLAFLVLTASRLTGRSGYGNQGDEEDDEYDLDLKELASFTNWMGTNLHDMFYGDDKYDLHELCLLFLPLALPAALRYLTSRYEWLNRLDAAKGLPGYVVITRNCAMFVALNSLGVYQDIKENSDCTNTSRWVAPDYPLSQIAIEFSEGWKVFHPPNLWLVRISHALLYPSVLLALSRRRMTIFLTWVLFFEMDFFQALADMVHYVSGPEMAEDRLDFRDNPNNCYVNVFLFQTLFAYPMNFIFLTTSLGDGDISLPVDGNHTSYS